jgi:hypothetical protein
MLKARSFPAEANRVPSKRKPRHVHSDATIRTGNRLRTAALAPLTHLVIDSTGETFVILVGSASEEALRDALHQLAATLRKRAPSIQAVLQAHGLPDVSEPQLAEGRLRATRRRATRRPR